MDAAALEEVDEIISQFNLDHLGFLNSTKQDQAMKENHVKYGLVCVTNPGPGAVATAAATGGTMAAAGNGGYQVVGGGGSGTTQHGYPMTPTSPGTPPEAGRGSDGMPSSPVYGSHHHHHGHHHQQMQYQQPSGQWLQAPVTGGVQCRGVGEPLDLRPPSGHDWHHHHHHHHHGGHVMHHPAGPQEPHHQPQHMYCDGSDDDPPTTGTTTGMSDESVGILSPEMMCDDQLMSLTVRELNKRLHGCPREEVVRLKQKRRTLKNRGYAQNCRSKRLAKSHELDKFNQKLKTELHRISQELVRCKHERDFYKQELDNTQNKSSSGSRKTGSSASDITLPPVSGHHSSKYY